MTITKKEIASKIQLYFEPIMAKEGFNWLKSRNLFERDLGEIQQVLVFEQHTFQPSDVMPIIEIASKDLARFRDKKEYHIDSFRVGEIPKWDAGEPNVLVFTFEASNSEVVLQQLADKIIHLGIPFLNRLSNYEKLIEFYIETGAIITRRNVLIDICLLTKNSEYAQLILDQFSEYRKGNQVSITDYGLDKIETEIKTSLSPLIIN